MCVLACTQHPVEDNLPLYPWTTTESALKELAYRAAKVKTVEAAGALTLTRPDGQSVRLDTAVAMQLPDKARIVATKLTRKIIDITLTPDGVWLVPPDDENLRNDVMPAMHDAAKATREWSWLAGRFFDAPPAEFGVEDDGGAAGERFAVVRPSPSGATIRCEVDRRTLTPRRYAVLDDNGQERFWMTLGAYRIIDGIYWATRIEASDGKGVILVELLEVALNEEPAPGAFVPPGRAEKLGQ